MIRPIDPLIRWWRQGDGKLPEPGAGLAGGAELSQAVPESSPGGEAPWLARLDEAGVPRTLVYPTTTLGRLLDQTADRWSNAIAIVYADKIWTYEQMRGEVNRVAGGLARLGVRRGDRVVITLPNCPEYAFCFYALQKLGAVMVNAGPLMGADDLQTIITMTVPRVIIGLDLQAPLLLSVAKDTAIEHFVWITLQSYQPVFKRLGYQLKLWHERHQNENGSPGEARQGPQEITLKALMEGAPARPPTIEPDPSHTAILQPTGGTTGVLKLVQLSHRSLIANAAQVCVWSGALAGQERFIVVLPMFHVYGLTTCLVSTVYTGARMLIMTRFHAGQLIDLVRHQQPTIFPLVPAMCDSLSGELMMRPKREPKKDHGTDGVAAAASELPNEKAAWFKTIRLCISGAAPLPREVAERFTHLTGVPIVEGYGLTEASPVTHVNPPHSPRAGSIGVPMPDTACRIVDLEDGETDVVGEEPGELLVSGPQVMSGYYSNPEETRRALSTDAGGRTWLHTGDVVRLDEDGYFFICDRKKDMIIRSGLKVYPLKVEKALKAHENVADAGVVGKPDAVHTETVVAFIVPSARAKDVSGLAEELRRYCRQHLAPYEVPAAFEIVERLPRTGLGKLQRTELRKLPVPSLSMAEIVSPETPSAAMSTPVSTQRPEFPPPTGAMSGNAQEAGGSRDPASAGDVGSSSVLGSMKPGSGMANRIQEVIENSKSTEDR